MEFPAISSASADGQFIHETIAHYYELINGDLPPMTPKEMLETARWGKSAYDHLSDSSPYKAYLKYMSNYFDKIIKQYGH